MIIYQCDYCEKQVKPTVWFPQMPALPWRIEHSTFVVSDRREMPDGPWSFCSLECMIDWATDRMAVKPDRRAD